MPTEVTTCKPIKSPATRRAMMNVAEALLKESHIEQTCSEWLALDRWYWLKTDPVSDTSTVRSIRGAIVREVHDAQSFETVSKILGKHTRGKGFGELGMTDGQYRRAPEASIASGIPEESAVCELMWIEWKAPKGKHAQHQRDWQEREKRRGFLVVRAGVDFPKTIEGFQAWYRRSGLMRRKI